MKNLFYRLIGISLLVVALTIMSTTMSTGTTYAATKTSPTSLTPHTHTLKPACSASVHFSPSDQTTQLGSNATVTAAVVCPDWIWGTDVAFNWGDGTGWYVQNTTDYTTFTHVYKRTGSFTAYGHVNGVPGNNVHIEVVQ